TCCTDSHVQTPPPQQAVSGRSTFGFIKISHDLRLEKCHVIRNVTTFVACGASSTPAVREATGAWAFISLCASSLPSKLKSFQKFTNFSPQLCFIFQPFHALLYVTSCAVVVKDIVPNCSANGSISSAHKYIPFKPSFSCLNVFRLPFSSFIPIKFSIQPAIKADTCSSVLFVNSNFIIATGMPLASASPGIRGLNTPMRTSTGISSSDNFTCPNGYAAEKEQLRNLGSPWLRT